MSDVLRTDRAQEVLTLRDVRRELGNKPVLDGVDLTVRRHATVGIRGPSGAGKTTLARVIAGIDTSFTGRRDCSAGAAHLVFQDSLQALNPRLSLRWSLAEAHAHGGSLWAIRSSARRQYRVLADALTEVGLPEDLLRVRPGNLSGGQRQRAALARAILSGASLLVLDEPVAALDPSVQARILNLLLRLHRTRDLTMVVISHDHAVLEFLCDDQLEIRGGKLWPVR